MVRRIDGEERRELLCQLWVWLMRCRNCGRSREKAAMDLWYVFCGRVAGFVLGVANCKSVMMFLVMRRSRWTVFDKGLWEGTAGGKSVRHYLTLESRHSLLAR